MHVRPFKTHLLLEDYCGPQIPAPYICTMPRGPHGLKRGSGWASIGLSFSLEIY